MLFSAGPGWNEASHLLGEHPLVPKLAVYGTVPIAALVPPLALFLSLLAGVIYGQDPEFAPRVYRWAAVAGLVYAVYGIFAELTNPGMLLWRQKTAYLDSITSTFVNHNTAATFFGSVAIIWYLWGVREIRRIINPARYGDIEYLIKKIRGLERFQLGYALAFFIALATTFMTRSRAGSLLTMAVLALVTALYLARELKQRRNIFIAAIALVAIGALGLEFAGGRLTSELETRGIYDAGRATTWLSSLHIVADHPWLGTGLGTFVSIFPSYRSPEGGVWGVWDRAHSTPIELLVEMGIPFSILVFGAWILMLWSMLRASFVDNRSRIYVVAGLGILVLGTLHSLVDFPLQIPGFSVFCGILGGTGFAAALLRPAVADYVRLPTPPELTPTSPLPANADATRASGPPGKFLGSRAEAD